jgi:hypothetical protein
MGNKTDRIVRGEKVEMKKLSILFSIVFILLIDCTFLFAMDLDYKRGEAITYADRHCRTGSYNEKYKSYGDKDCANFVSQVLIDRGFDFNDFGDDDGAQPIGKQGTDSEGRMGFPTVKKLKEVLKRSSCFKITTDPQEAKPGDVLVWKDESHVAIYAGNDKYYAHTENRCDGSAYVNNPKNLWNDAEIYHFIDDYKCMKCDQDGKKVELEQRGSGLAIIHSI